MLCATQRGYIRDDPQRPQSYGASRQCRRKTLQDWLVKAAPGQTITPDSEVNIATQTTGPRATLDDAAMPAGTYQWRTAAVNAHGSLISRWTPVQSVTLNSECALRGAARAARRAPP